MERRRVVLCKRGPAGAMDQALLVAGGHSRIETVASLGEALNLCLKESVDDLIVNMFSFTSSELTALNMFRQLKPDQRVSIFCPEEAVTMLMSADLADACHPVAAEREMRGTSRRVRV